GGHPRPTGGGPEGLRGRLPGQRRRGPLAGPAGGYPRRGRRPPRPLPGPRLPPPPRRLPGAVRRGIHDALRDRGGPPARPDGMRAAPTANAGQPLTASTLRAYSRGVPRVESLALA